MAPPSTSGFDGRFHDRPRQIAVPTLASGASFQTVGRQPRRQIQRRRLINGSGHVRAGNLEFWPNNYGTTNAAASPGQGNDT
jgi:hypothetical protein